MAKRFPMPNVVRLLKQIKQQPDHKERLACSYGVHDFAEQDIYRVCTKCDAAYVIPEKLAEFQRVHSGQRLPVAEAVSFGPSPKVGMLARRSCLSCHEEWGMHHRCPALGGRWNCC